MKDNKSLLGISDEMLLILNELEEYASEFDGEIPDEMWDRLIISREELDEKVGAYSFRITELKGDMDILKSQIEIWQKKIEGKERAIERMKWVLAEVVKRLGQRNDKGNFSLKTDTFNVGYQFSHPVEIEDRDSIPEKFKAYNLALNNLDIQQLQQLKDYIISQFGIEEELIKSDFNVSKTLLKQSIEADTMKMNTEEFTLTENIPGCYIDNKKGFVRIY